MRLYNNARRGRIQWHERVQLRIKLCVRELAKAHREGDEDAMRKLSQERERLKKELKRYCAYPGCGLPCKGRHCWMHAVAFRREGRIKRLAA